MVKKRAVEQAKDNRMRRHDAGHRGVGDIVGHLHVHQQRSGKVMVQRSCRAPVSSPPVRIPRAAMQGARGTPFEPQSEGRGKRRRQGRADLGLDTHLQFCRMKIGGAMYITSETSIRLFDRISMMKSRSSSVSSVFHVPEVCLRCDDSGSLGEAFGRSGSTAAMAPRGEPERTAFASVFLQDGVALSRIAKAGHQNY
eukprot:SAG31_NODE_2902_length_4931_cov_3.338369_6_plen_197_part_00